MAGAAGSPATGNSIRGGRVDPTMDGPNPIVAGMSMLAARRLAPPAPTGSGDVPTERLDEVQA